jgi:hypothetical protein
MKTLKEAFSMRKVGYLFFLKNYVKGDRCTLLYAWGAMMLDDRMLNQTRLQRCNSPVWCNMQAACA